MRRRPARLRHIAGLYAVEAPERPMAGHPVGAPGPGGKGWERGPAAGLADDGLKDAATGVRGWNRKANVGIQPVGHGLFHLAVNGRVDGKQTADLTLARWTGDARKPFVPVTAEDRDALAKASIAP